MPNAHKFKKNSNLNNKLIKNKDIWLIKVVAVQYLSESKQTIMDSQINCLFNSLFVC